MPKYRYIGQSETFNGQNFTNGEIYEGKWTSVKEVDGKKVIGIFHLKICNGHYERFVGAFYKDFELIKKLSAIQMLEAKAELRFYKLLDKTIQAMYEARMENNAAVLSEPIKQLRDTFHDDIVTAYAKDPET